MRRNLSVLIFVTLALVGNLAAQSKPEAPEYSIKEHYTKYEYRIPMRDGVHLSPPSMFLRIVPAPTHF